MSHLIGSKSKLLQRIRRVRGQAEALERAIEGESECSAILQQVAAMKGAIDSLTAEIFESQVREHLVPGTGSVRQRNADAEDLIRVIRTYLR